MQSNKPPQSLLRFEPAVEIHPEMRSYHQRSHDSNPNNTLSSSTVPPKVEDILDSIIPPQDWTDSMDKLYIQYVSHQPASREDVLELQERLNLMLEDRQARMKGVCPIREELYSQAFDEIIRQVAVDCPERGLLLMRVRDEHKMTLAAYQTIYQSSVNFGMKKQVESEEGADDLEDEVKLLEEMGQELEEKKDLLIGRKELKEREIREREEAEIGRREEELRFLKMQTENLGKFLEIVKEELR